LASWPTVFFVKYMLQNISPETINGRVPVGSGRSRSWNQRKPSLARDGSNHWLCVTACSPIFDAKLAVSSSGPEEEATAKSSSFGTESISDSPAACSVRKSEVPLSYGDVASPNKPSRAPHFCLIVSAIPRKMGNCNNVQLICPLIETFHLLSSSVVIFLTSC